MSLFINRTTEIDTKKIIIQDYRFVIELDTFHIGLNKNDFDMLQYILDKRSSGKIFMAMLQQVKWA